MMLYSVGICHMIPHAGSYYRESSGATNPGPNIDRVDVEVSPPSCRNKRDHVDDAIQNILYGYHCFP